MTTRSEGAVHLTPRGKHKLEEELRYLKNDKRDEIAEFMQSIMEEGDISENSGYDDARAKMGALESRIFELETLLAKAVVVEDSAAGALETVNIGATVDLEDAAGKHRTFLIVGTHEVDTLKGHISDDSPMGKALLGRRVGDVVAVPTPRGGPHAYTVREIRFE